MVTFSDPLFARQWHFKLMGDIGTIWNEYSGDGVTVGVYDDGVQYTHPDLNDNYEASLHFSYDGVTYDPFPINLIPGSDADGHGTSVAGLIAGEAGNRIGGVGVARGATITGVNLLSDPAFSDDAVSLASFRYAASFDIMVNSWGFAPYFYDFLNRSDPNSLASQTERAFGYAVENGRDGLGTVIVKAAGNEGTNANAEGINGSRFLINVAAVTSTGAATSYSNYGANILVSAGDASVTTDLLGANGYNTAAGLTGNYTSSFGGTSAATPLVSGVVALMLEANENLGWRDVQSILATSAALTGSVVDGRQGYEVSGTYFALNWSDPDSIRYTGKDTWNDGGRAYSTDYGFGRVDAFAAVRMAEVWTILQGGAKTSENEVHLTLADPTDRVIEANPGSYTTKYIPYAFDEHLNIEHVDLTITINSTAVLLNNGYLWFNLISPDGSTFPIALSTDQTDGPFIETESGDVQWTFGISHALGMDAFGDWTLAFGPTPNLAYTGLGTITDFKLDFYGSAWDFENVHHITKDYLRTVAKEGLGVRDRIITDGNGGTDWLNMSSIAGAVTITLDSLGKIIVGGVQWATIGLGQQIENLITGDDADRISGSALANELYSMRGADTLYGLAGMDSLHGGGSSDQVFGGTDADELYGDAGSDVLDGGLGDDTIYGGSGNDRITEKTDGGNDVVYGGTGRDTVTLGVGDDIFYDEAETGAAGADTVAAGAGNDTLVGAGGADSLAGDAGDDSIFGGEGNDILAGGTGLDVIGGGDGNDAVSGGDGDDALTGDAGADRVFGDAGNDTLLGGDANDTVSGGIGDDSIEGGEGLDSLTGGDGLDTVSGGNGNDQIFGDRGNDLLRGGDANDTVSGGRGDDSIEGGAGLDSLSGGRGRDTLNGGVGEDRLLGGSGADQLSGGDGSDTIIGGTGADTLFGDLGNDVLTGGRDADTFVFNAGFGTDRVADFSNNFDTLSFAADWWGGITDAIEFVSTFGRVVGSTVVFEFSGGNSVTVSGQGSLAVFFDDVSIA